MKNKRPSEEPDTATNPLSETSKPAESPDDPFNPETLRLDQSYLQQPAAKKLLTTVPVGKPGKQDFFRVHPADDYRLAAALVELREERETFLVLPRFVSELGDGEFFGAVLHLCINRQKVLRIWPVKTASPDGRQNAWQISAAEAAERAMKTWVRLKPNMSLGSYEIFEAVGNFGEPEWPELPFMEILRIAFKGHVIEGPDHPVVHRLRGVT